MSNEETKDSGNIKVFYQYSPLYRTVFVGGAWGGIAPNGLIQLALFNDLRPMPEMVTHGVVNNELGPELEKLEKRGIVREVEATLLMPLSIAISLLPVMKQMIDQVETIQAAAQTAQAEKA